ncbi:hypothetical protein H5410_022305 [Solanum commersonii]|uniref:Uncharacterized protein n=1 Tax=Solanum commersonii TaxID=4109 RepID=A0A9J5ZGS6_SOLCO|nr:hypothetical protein H5410_022305 [Solanum commersonii]
MEKKQGLNFAKILVVVEMGEKFVDSVFFKNANGEVIEENVVYALKPTHCSFYNKYKHSNAECWRENLAKKGEAKKNEKH